MGLELTAELANICAKWQINQLSIFGSFARGQARADSDIDLLVVFAPTAQIGLLDHVRMQRDLESYFGRPVDMITQSALDRMSNSARKEDIVKHLKIIYAA